MEYININIRGLISNLEELRHFVSTRKASFICVCETFLTGAVPDSAITISEYSFFRKDRGSHGGGLVVYFKSHLNVSRLILEAVEYETIWFSTHTRDYHYVCCAAYWPPNTQTILTEHLSDSMLSLNFSYNTCLLIMGDFNAISLGLTVHTQTMLADCWHHFWRILTCISSSQSPLDL